MALSRRFWILFWLILPTSMALFGILASYLRNPHWDAAIFNALPLGIFFGLCLLFIAIALCIKQRKVHRLLWLAFYMPFLGAIPIATWHLGDVIFAQSSQWDLFIFSDLDNGLSHQKIDRFESASQCALHGETLMMTPPKLQIKGCDGNVCLANRYFCGLDCAVDSSEENIFISDIICREKTLGH